MYNQNYGGIPKITQNMRIPGLPNRPPFVPALQVRERMRSYLHLVHGYLLLELESKANNNDLRGNLYWTMATNGFQNNQYNELLISTCEYAEIIMTQLAPADAIQKAVHEMCSVAAALEADRHPSLMNELNQAGLEDLHTWKQHFNQIGMWVKNYMMANPEYPANYQQPNQYGGGYQQGGQPHYGNQGYPINTMQNNVPVDQMWGNRGPTGGGYIPRGNSYSNNTGPSHGIFTGRNVDPFFDDGPKGTRRTGSSLKPVSRNNQPQQSQQYTEQRPMEDFPESKEVNNNAIIKIPAKISKEKLTFDPEMPHASLYDPDHFKMFHVTENGKTREELEEIDEVNYDEHETEYFFKSMVKSPEEIQRDRDAAAKVFSNLLAEKDVDAYIKAFSENDGLSDDTDQKLSVMMNMDTTVAIEHDLICEGLKSVHHAYRNFYLDNFEISDYLDNKNIRFAALIADSYWLAGESKINFMELSTSPDYETFAKRLRNFIDKTPSAQMMMKTIVNSATDHVNDILSIRMGLNIRIDTIILDIGDLRKAIIQKHGERLLEVFDKTCAEVVSQNCAYTDSSIVFSDIEDNEAITPIRHSMNVLLTLHSDDFLARMHGDSAVVMESRFPELFKAIRATFAKCNDKTRYVSFITSDGEIIRLHKSLMGDAYLISR